jgi:hypothetical protein
VTVHYIAPQGLGRQDGLSLDNAYPISSINSAIANYRENDVIQVAGHLGDYHRDKPVDIKRGGVPGGVVQIGPVPNTTPRFTGNRATPYDPEGVVGTDAFRLLDDASYIEVQGFEFEGLASAFRLGSPLVDISLSGHKGANVRRFVENFASGDWKQATVVGLTVADVDVRGFSKNAVRLRYDTQDVTLRNVRGDSMHEDGDNFAIGVLLEGSVHAVKLESCVMENALATTDNYWNGDGFTTGPDTYDITFTDTEAAGNADAGYDLKGNAITLERAIAFGNKRNFRVWETSTLDHCIGISPQTQGGSGQVCQLWLGPKNPAVEVVGTTFFDNDTDVMVVQSEGLGTRTRFTDCRIAYSGMLSSTPAIVDAIGAQGWKR